MMKGGREIEVRLWQRDVSNLFAPRKEGFVGYIEFESVRRSGVRVTPSCSIGFWVPMTEEQR